MDIFAFIAHAQYPNPLGEIDTFLDLVKAIADGVFYFALPIGTLAMIFVGIQFITASGNPGKLADVRKKFLWVLIGTALLIGASVLAGAVVDYIQNPEASGFRHIKEYRDIFYG